MDEKSSTYSKSQRQYMARTKPRLVSVPEVLVLLIRHCRPNLRGHIRILHLLSSVIAALIGPDIIQEERKRCNGTTGLGTHHGELCRSVIGGISSLECLWADDVSEREGTADNSSSKGSLRCASKVGSGPLR